MPEPLPSNNPLGEPFVELDSVDSTNNYALAQIHAGLAQHGQAFFAWEQYAGKGQRGRVWVSEKGNNLIISLAIRPSPLGPRQQFQLSACLALSVARWFSRYAGDETRIKWPNDLYWHDRKAGGILVESIVSGAGSGRSEWKWAVAGMGININQVQFQPELVNPVSLRQITGKTWPVKDLAMALCREIDQHWQQLLQHGFEDLLKDYNELLYRRGQETRFRAGNRSFTARLLRVDESGLLWLDEGMEKSYSFGEISLIPEK